MPLLFRMLYGCGLRISEALNLKVRDVDMDAGVLTIWDGKFNKDRLVPLSDELLDRCRALMRSRFIRFQMEMHTFSLPTMDKR